MEYYDTILAIVSFNSFEWFFIYAVTFFQHNFLEDLSTFRFTD